MLQTRHYDAQTFYYNEILIGTVFSNPEKDLQLLQSRSVEEIVVFGSDFELTQVSQCADPDFVVPDLEG